MRNLAFVFLAFSVIFLSSFIPKEPNSKKEISEEGVFVCNVNGKDVVLRGAKAQFRTITGGHKQLSLSNDKFEAFVFINPVAKKMNFKECTNREVFIRYIEPGTDKIYKPADGFVDLKSIDLEKGTVSGTFEMILINKEQPEKKITVKNGSFTNLPINEIKTY